MISRTIRPTVFISDPNGIFDSLIRQRFFRRIDSGLSANRPLAVASVCSTEQLIAEIADSPGAIGVICFNSESANSDLVKAVCLVAQSREVLNQCKLVAVVGEEMHPAQFQLAIAGFALVIRSAAELDRMVAATERYWRTFDWPELSIEESVQRDLPWQPIG